VTQKSTLQAQALATGKYYLIDIDKVLDIYKEAGFDVEDEDADVPTNLQVGSENCFFTGDFIRRGERYYEIVIAAEGFTWEEVENEDEDMIEGDD
jgi:hypothetical protein